jgi:hypothetical protein
MPNRSQHCSRYPQSLTYLVILKTRYGSSARSQPCGTWHGALQQVAASGCSCQLLCRPKDTSSKRALPEDAGPRCQCSHSSEDAARLSNMNIVPANKVRLPSRASESKEAIPSRLHPFGNRTGTKSVVQKQSCRLPRWQVHSPYA